MRKNQECNCKYHAWIWRLIFLLEIFEETIVTAQKKNEESHWNSHDGMGIHKVSKHGFCRSMQMWSLGHCTASHKLRQRHWMSLGQPSASTSIPNGQNTSSQLIGHVFIPKHSKNKQYITDKRRVKREMWRCWLTTVSEPSPFSGTVFV